VSLLAIVFHADSGHKFTACHQNQFVSMQHSTSSTSIGSNSINMNYLGSPSLVASVSKKNNNANKNNLLFNFVPSKYTVICGRGKACSNYTGNLHLKLLVNNYLKPYSEAKSKINKSTIVSAIIATVRQACYPVAAFVKHEQDGAWWEVDDAFAREKIGCLLRDRLHTQYRSSTKAKLARKALENVSPSASKQNTTPCMALEKLPTLEDSLQAPPDIQHRSEACHSRVTSASNKEIVVTYNSSLPNPLRMDSQHRSDDEACISKRLTTASNKEIADNYDSHVSSPLSRMDRREERVQRSLRADFSRGCLPSPLPIAAKTAFLDRKSVLKEAYNAAASDLADDLPDDISAIFD
jgi:hypothetical protein